MTSIVCTRSPREERNTISYVCSLFLVNKLAVIGMHGRADLVARV